MQHMTQQQAETVDRAATYIIGGGGITWGSFVAFSGELTTVFGMITAFIGMCLVSWRLIRDIRKARKK